MEPSGSPIPSKTSWMIQIQAVGTALSKLQKIEELVHFSYNVSSIRVLKSELESLSSFFNFLTETQNIILSPELGYFCVLPPEIIFLVLSNLDPKELCRLCCVCRYFREMGDEESIWQSLFSRLDLNKIGDEYLNTQKTWKWLCQSKLHVFHEGEIKNGVGMYIWPCKVTLPANNKHENRYCGEWKDDKREGYGTYYWCNGSLYAGEWKNDKREGSGTRTWPNGNKYVGEYKNHKRHGTGGFKFSNGSVFNGQFEDNKFVHGTYTWPNGRIYDGDWNNIFRHGKGSYWWPDGRTYIGEWKGDKRHGQGKYTWPDGDFYQGPFVEGRRWGVGIFTRSSNGEHIHQDWKEEKFEEFNKGVIDTDLDLDIDTNKNTNSNSNMNVDANEDKDENENEGETNGNSDGNSNPNGSTSSSTSNSTKNKNKKRAHNVNDEDTEDELSKQPKLSTD